MTEPRIFVNIAAYRDTECQWTVKDLFEKARHPDLLALGICWQFVAEEDQDCFLFRTRPDQCRVIEVDARESKGACWARHQAQSLWRSEKYTLQIDSHMRFAQDWDDTLLAMLATCPSERPVLSTYPPGYTPPDTIDSEALSVMYARAFDPNGILKLHSYAVDAKDAPPAPQSNPFIAAGFLFADSRINEEIPYDPYLYFQGEEITLAARLWTHGWDLFSPNQVLIYHDYGKRPSRRRHWNDHERWSQLNDLSFKRVRHLLGMEACDDAEALRDIEHYGLGNRRSLAEYEAFSGVDFRNRLIGGKTTAELEAAEPAEERRRRNIEVFEQIWKSNSWGATETRSGSGSTLASTETLRTKLPQLFDFLGIRTLTDAGCGDLNWMSHLSQGLQLYFGLDVVEEMATEVRQKFGRRRGHFFNCTDITIDDLPATDAIFCRDVLTHLPDYGVTFALERFKASGSRYLIATTHPHGSNKSIQPGGWQPIDMTAAPFNLPPPRYLLSEGLPNSAKALGVWLIADIP